MDADLKSMPGIVRRTDRYDSCLLTLKPAFTHDLKQKLKVMADGPGNFLRATFYRWSERFPGVWLEAISAPAVWAGGDVNVGNFGTWLGGGLIRWGLNDFDEAGWKPFTNDHVRPATSALLARSDVDAEMVGRTILSGSSERIRGGGFGTLDLASDTELRASVRAAQISTEAFFEKLAGKDELDADEARRLARLCKRLNEAVPGGEFHYRRAGRRSLGRVRVFILGKGDPPVAIEAKRVLRSAWSWARRGGHADPTAADDRNDDLSALLPDARRGPDPQTSVEEIDGVQWVCGLCRRTRWVSASVMSAMSAKSWRPGCWSAGGLKLRISTCSRTIRRRSCPISPATSHQPPATSHQPGWLTRAVAMKEDT
jgi:hypothetical protein